MITYNSGGGLGNRLFMYVFARLLAERNGLELGTSWEQAHEKGFGAVHRNDGDPLVVYFTDPEPGKRYEGEPILIEEMKRVITPDTDLPPGRYHLNGYWQNAEWYLKHRDKIRSWVKNNFFPLLDKTSIVMHVRLGDYKICNSGQVLDHKYYRDCLLRENYGNVFVLTDEPDDEYFKPFKEDGYVVTKTNENDDFWFITQFDRIICGNSTFSWWAAFLSDASRIYLPSCWMRGLKNPVMLTKIQNGIVMPATFKDYDVK